MTSRQGLSQQDTRTRERLHSHAERFTQIVRSVAASMSSTQSFQRIGMDNIVEAVKAGMEITEVIAAGCPGHEKLAVLTEAVLVLVDESNFAGDYEPIVLTLVPHLVNTLIVVREGKLRVNRGLWRRIRRRARYLLSQIGCVAPAA